MRAARTLDDLAAISFRTGDAWEAWLEERHEDTAEVWVRLAKKGSGVESVSYEEAVEVALCFGWIDGLARAADERTYLQRFTPRTRRSSWSESNRVRACVLVESGRMRPAGLRAIERARAEGRWDPEAAAARRTCGSGER